MDLQHRLMRQTINIAVSKALEDMKSNTKRSIRNLIDLGLLFSRSENQKWFFSTAQKVISNPKNPYNLLTSRVIADVDNDTIKTVGLNLGYSSLTYGANKLQKRQDSLDCSFPWIVIFKLSDSAPDCYEQITNLIREGRELGVYSYVFCPREADDIFALCQIAKRFGECMFVFNASPSLITDQTAGAVGETHNAVVSVLAAEADLHRESCMKAFRILKQNRCLFGSHFNYNEDNIEKVATPEFIRSAIRLGNLFAVYIADSSVSDAHRDAVYTFVCNERGETGQPLIALEWFQDIRNISEKILSGGGCMAVNLGEKARMECKKVKHALENSLFEIIRNTAPCLDI